MLIIFRFVDLLAFFDMFREALKKTFESVSLLILRGWGGGSASQRSQFLRFFWLVLGGTKTNFVFNPNSIFHIFSDLFHHVNRASL